jgi:hypothetical protein
VAKRRRAPVDPENSERRKARKQRRVDATKNTSVKIQLHPNIALTPLLRAALPPPDDVELTAADAQHILEQPPPEA